MKRFQSGLSLQYPNLSHLITYFDHEVIDIFESPSEALKQFCIGKTQPELFETIKEIRKLISSTPNEDEINACLDELENTYNYEEEDLNVVEWLESLISYIQNYLIKTEK